MNRIPDGGYFDNASDAISEAEWLAEYSCKDVAVCCAGYPNLAVYFLENTGHHRVLEVLRAEPWGGWDGEFSRSIKNASKQKNQAQTESDKAPY